MLNIHEDSRRRLIDFGSWAETKVLTCKEDCIIGNHYHKLKTEMFYILDGLVIYDGVDYIPGMVINVPAFKYHSFNCKAGTRILGFASKPYDKTDEHAQ